VLCAICDEVNEDLILTQDVVNQLFHWYKLNIVSCVSDEQVNDNTVCNQNDVSADGHRDMRIMNVNMSIIIVMCMILMMQLI